MVGKSKPVNPSYSVDSAEFMSNNWSTLTRRECARSTQWRYSDNELLKIKSEKRVIKLLKVWRWARENYPVERVEGLGGGGMGVKCTSLER